MTVAGAMALAAMSAQAGDADLSNASEECPEGDKQCEGLAAHGENAIANTGMDACHSQELASGARALASPPQTMVCLETMKAPTREFATATEAPGVLEVATAFDANKAPTDFDAVEPTQVASVGQSLPPTQAMGLRALAVPGPRMTHAGFSVTERDLSGF